MGLAPGSRDLRINCGYRRPQMFGFTFPFYIKTPWSVPSHAAGTWPPDVLAGESFRTAFWMGKAARESMLIRK